MEKQTNKSDEIKRLKYVLNLIIDANCFRVGVERGHGEEWCTWGREGGTWEYPPSAFGLCLTSELSSLSREGQHQVQLFTSAAHTKYQGLHHSALQYHLAFTALKDRPTQHILNPRNVIMHCQYKLNAAMQLCGVFQYDCMCWKSNSINSIFLLKILINWVVVQLHLNNASIHSKSAKHQDNTEASCQAPVLKGWVGSGEGQVTPNLTFGHHV